MLLEGCSEKITVNEKKGINWLKEACKNNHMQAIEYKGNTFCPQLTTL